MIAVSNTSPLNYLILIEAVDVLPILFERVIVPPAVVAELQHPHTPEAVRTWIQSPPAWLETRTPTPPLMPIRLGLGELEAVTLAIEIGADRVLLDDRRARRSAAEAGLTVIGTVAVLVEGGQRGLLDIAETVLRLSATSFRINPTLLAQLTQP